MKCFIQELTDETFKNKEWKWHFKEVLNMSEVTIIFSDDDKKNLEKYMEATHGGKWNIHNDFDIMDIMQVVLNDIDKKVNSK